jgi:hypothetical protein
MEEVIKMMRPGDKPSNQEVQMFEDYGAQTGFKSTAADAVPLLEGFCFHNAADCPDCDNGMVKQGGCFSCPACGFSVCS